MIDVDAGIVAVFTLVASGYVAIVFDDVGVVACAGVDVAFVVVYVVASAVVDVVADLIFFHFRFIFQNSLERSEK